MTNNQLWAFEYLSRNDIQNAKKNAILALEEDKTKKISLLEREF